MSLTQRRKHSQWWVWYSRERPKGSWSIRARDLTLWGGHRLDLFLFKIYELPISHRTRDGLQYKTEMRWSRTKPSTENTGKDADADHSWVLARTAKDGFGETGWCLSERDLSHLISFYSGGIKDMVEKGVGSLNGKWVYIAKAWWLLASEGVCGERMIGACMKGDAEGWRWLNSQEHWLLFRGPGFDS